MGVCDDGAGARSRDDQGAGELLQSALGYVCSVLVVLGVVCVPCVHVIGVARVPWCACARLCM